MADIRARLRERREAAWGEADTRQRSGRAREEKCSDAKEVLEAIDKSA
jgi:hypothetical protein